MKQTLWDTLNLIKSKGITTTEANSIATQSREIMRVVRTEMAVIAMNGAKGKKKLLGVGKNESN